MRVSLSHKFVLGSLAVSLAVVSFPRLFSLTGFAVAHWVTPFVALGLGGVLGFALSRELAGNFQSLRGTTERISQGDLTVDVQISDQARFVDETHDLARSVQGMLASLRELVGHVQRTADRVSRAAQDLSRSSEQASKGNEGGAITGAGMAVGTPDFMSRRIIFPSRTSTSPRISAYFTSNLSALPS